MIAVVRKVPPDRTGTGFSGFLIFGGMLGYVIKGDISSITEDIKEEVKNALFHEKGISVGQVSEDIKELLSESVPHFNHSFKSKHVRAVITYNTIITEVEDILMYHIFFDIT